MGFDLKNYETVKERKKRFYSDNPDGRIIVELINVSTILEYALFRATIYRTGEDQKNQLPWSTGYAMELRDKELSKSKKGEAYESVNYSSWTENGEESACGRGLDNAGYAGNNKCSREEMQKVQRMNNTIKKQQLVKLQPGNLEKAIIAIGSVKDSSSLDTMCRMFDTRTWTESEKKELTNAVDLKLSEILENAN